MEIKELTDEQLQTIRDFLKVLNAENYHLVLAFNMDIKNNYLSTKMLCLNGLKEDLAEDLYQIAAKAIGKELGNRLVWFNTDNSVKANDTSETNKIEKEE